MKAHVWNQRMTHTSNQRTTHTSNPRITHSAVEYPVKPYFVGLELGDSSLSCAVTNGAYELLSFNARKLGGGQSLPTGLMNWKALSPKVKQSAWSALCMLDDIVHLEQGVPERIFVADRGHHRDEKAITKQDLYAMQGGRCMYTGRPIDLEQIDTDYDIDHIYPRSLVKDDGVDNLVLVEKKANAIKSDEYPVPRHTQQQQEGFWRTLRHQGLISNEKYWRLTRTDEINIEDISAFIKPQFMTTNKDSEIVMSVIQYMYPHTEVVYVNSETVSDFRNELLPMTIGVHGGRSGSM